MMTTTMLDLQDYAAGLAAVECFAKYGSWPRIVRSTEPGDVDADVDAMLRAYQECAAAQRPRSVRAELALDDLFAQRLTVYPVAGVIDALLCVVNNWRSGARWKPSE
jgi:hypothetical protein